MIKTILKYAALGLLSAIFIFWGISIAKCEYQTAKYGDQFENLYKEYTMIATPDYLKVLEYDDNKAVVYYVKKRVGGNVLVFERENGESEWGFEYWETIWSRGGSASDFVWPYIR